MRRSDLDVVYHSIQSIEAIVAGRDMADLLVLMSCLCSSSFTSSDAEVVGQVGHTSSGQAVARSIISTLSTTVRLRQDLVSRLVAQLTTVLVQLVGLFRSLRVAVSATGGRAPLQIRAAQRQVPTWLDLEKEPLGIEEARLFARLLATITTRSTTASALSLPKKKADNKALSRAFSNHAAYVLIAYVRTLVGGGDSATTISSEVRTELLLGLMGLCDIVGEHQRDAAMMLLEQGERLLFKNVWNEWRRSGTRVYRIMLISKQHKCECNGSLLPRQETLQVDKLALVFISLTLDDVA
ncbi:hypothetical protein L7F22_067136 [Adiantum nelumboides]|nr:hypothetical protein [Adiantum nelumboides]